MLTVCNFNCFKKKSGQMKLKSKCTSKTFYLQKKTITFLFYTFTFCFGSTKWQLAILFKSSLDCRNPLVQSPFLTAASSAAAAVVRWFASLFLSKLC